MTQQSDAMLRQMLKQKERKTKMAISANKGPAAGKGLKTPAPNILSRQSHNEVYGGPQWGGKVFDDPGQRTVSPLAAELERAGDEGRLAAIRAKGVTPDDNWQTRKIADTNVPTAFGHRDRNASPAKVPGSVAPAQSEPVRKPGK